MTRASATSLTVAVTTDIFPPRYQDVRHLARGGMGDVFSARDTVLGRTVALKLLAERYADSEEIKRRFRREALAAARLSNAPYTVTIFDVGDANGQPFIVMELLDGGSLEDRLRKGRPRTDDVLRWLGQAAAALDAGHEAGVVHRDVKPGNLLLNARGEVRVADFGVASAVGLDSLTMTGTVLGTAGYLSPEQARGERATPASDRYALAIVAWQLLTGRRPFESESLTAEAAAHVNAPIPSISEEGGLPPQLDRVFARALAKDPADRYPTAAEFVAAVQRALHQAERVPAPVASVTVDRYIPSHAAPARAPVRRRSPAAVWAGLALLALLLLGSGLALAGIFGDEEPQAQVTTVVETRPGTTVTTEVTTTAPSPPPPAAPTTQPPAPAPTPPPAPPASGESGVALTDRATRLLRQGRWAEAEVVARQAVAKLDGSGELYEAYAKYDLGRALAEQGECEEAVPLLNESEQIQGTRAEIREARALCQ
jgi:serine/threonine protein kinase